MWTKKILVCFFALGLSSSVFSDWFHIEDPELSLVSEKISALIKESVNFSVDECQFRGKEFDLDGDGESTDIIATASCGMGAARGPIWILKKQKSKYVIILSASGAALTLSETTSNGIKDIQDDSGSAGHATVSLYKFNGIEYIKKSYYFSADDKNECIKHKDICPFVID